MPPSLSASGGLPCRSGCISSSPLQGTQHLRGFMLWRELLYLADQYFCLFTRSNAALGKQPDRCSTSASISLTVSLRDSHPLPYSPALLLLFLSECFSSSFLPCYASCFSVVRTETRQWPSKELAGPLLLCCWTHIYGDTVVRCWQICMFHIYVYFTCVFYASMKQREQHVSQNDICPIRRCFLHSRPYWSMEAWHRKHWLKVTEKINYLNDN